MGNLLTDKYAEGVPGMRYYEGCDNVDDVEAYAAELACKLFGCDHAYVQPHSGADANLIAYWAVLQARVEAPELERLGQTDPSKLSRDDWNKLRATLGNQRLLGMDYYSGGHLTHGSPANMSGRYFNFIPYKVDSQTERIDFDQVRKLAVENRPKMIVAGASAYPRIIEADKFREIADEVGAMLMVDMAHFAGLVAAGVHPNPVEHAHIVTTTTHKTLRGPRGGAILAKEEFGKLINKAIFPGMQGGPLMHIIAGKAVCFKEAATPEFVAYQKQVLLNSKKMAEELLARGYKLVSGGTDNHLVLLNLTNKNITGKDAEHLLDAANITTNKNTIPNDPNGTNVTSGIRLGTPAMTTRGFKEPEIAKVVEAIALILDHPSDASAAEKAKKIVQELCEAYPLYQ
jgi:glycine hydroxymethyltransferase